MRARAGRIRRLYNGVALHGEHLDESEFIARYAIENGISTSTVRVYVRELLTAGFITRHDGCLIVVKEFGNVW
jgi:hypothetical protein